MAEKESNDPIVDVQVAYSKAETYIEENKKSLSIIIGAVIVLVGGYFLWKYWYVAGQDAEAQKQLFTAQNYFEKDSLDKAIAGLDEVAGNYGVTPAGAIAEYCLGISYLKKGEYEKAIEHLKEFDADDEILGPVASGAIGDAYMELGKTDEAISYYMKAADLSENKFVSPIYLKKAGMAYESAGNFKDAVKVYEKIKTDYEKSTEGRDIERFLSRAKALAGE